MSGKTGIIIKDPNVMKFISRIKEEIKPDKIILLGIELEEML